VPADWIEPASFGVEAFTSIYVSMGVTAPHYAGEVKSTPHAESVQPDWGK
jgi:uncharacterized membrane protein